MDYTKKAPDEVPLTPYSVHSRLINVGGTPSQFGDRGYGSPPSLQDRLVEGVAAAHRQKNYSHTDFRNFTRSAGMPTGRVRLLCSEFATTVRYFTPTISRVAACLG